MGEARDIYKSACAEIATALSDEGFRYLSSKQSLVSERGDLSCQINFQSSFRNYILPRSDDVGGLVAPASILLPAASDIATFGSVTLISHALVHSKKIKLWRASQEGRVATGDRVTGGQIGNLQPKPKWIEFNLANPHRRQRVIYDAIKLIRSVAFPYFQLFSDPSHVIEALLEGTVQWDWEHSALEYVLCFGTVEQAQNLLARYLVVRPERLAEYRQRVQEYRERGIPVSFDSTAAGRLAQSALSLGLE